MTTRIRSLVFEDNDMLRSLLWKVLDGRNHEVFSFPDPALCPLGLKKCEQCELSEVCADIIFSDIEMIHSNGMDFIEELVGSGCRCSRFVLMSGNWSEADLARAKNLGCKTLEKPFSIIDVISVCEEIEQTIDRNRKLTQWFLGEKAEVANIPFSKLRSRKVLNTI